MLGFLCHLLGIDSLFIALFAWMYALGFGIAETLGLPVRVPGSTWQVPAQWLRGRAVSVQTLIWGALLGPGLLTRNPYAGIWLLLPLLALSQNVSLAVDIGIAVGIAHGGTRALGILRNRTCIADPYAHLLILGKYWLWQYLDGLALLVVAGALSVYIFSLSDIHL